MWSTSWMLYWCSTSFKVIFYCYYYYFYFINLIYTLSLHHHPLFHHQHPRFWPPPTPPSIVCASPLVLNKWNVRRLGCQMAIRVAVWDVVRASPLVLNQQNVTRFSTTSDYYSFPSLNFPPVSQPPYLYRRKLQLEPPSWVPLLLHTQAIMRDTRPLWALHAPFARKHCSWTRYP